jgi:hypothetical protein
LVLVGVGYYFKVKLTMLLRVQGATIMISALMLLCTIGVVVDKYSIVAEDTIDTIEINHLYDELGRHVLDQMIFWNSNRNAYMDNKEVLCWILIKNGRRPCSKEELEIIKRQWRNAKVVFPRGYEPTIWMGINIKYERHTDMYNFTFIDTSDIMRRVRSKTIMETWTQHDPELAHRQFLPKEQRKGLTIAVPLGIMSTTK